VLKINENCKKLHFRQTDDKTRRFLPFPIKPSIPKYALVLVEGFSDPQSHLILGAAPQK